MLPSAHINLVQPAHLRAGKTFGDAFGADVGVCLSQLARLVDSSSSTRALAIDGVAQHWPHGLNGHYGGKMDDDDTPSCLNVMATNRSLDIPPNDAKQVTVREAMERHAPLLRGVRWVPFYESTKPLHFAHTRCIAGGHLDCTHFCYVPGILDPLWRALLSIDV